MNIHRKVYSRGGALVGGLAIVAAAGLAVPATAAAGTVTSLTSCQAITVPGTYRLDADVTTASFLCFDITASNVTLLLNGHSATETGFLGTGISVEPGAANATILGPGTVIGGFRAWGIELDGGNGQVRGVTAETDAGSGIVIDSSGNDVRDNVASADSVSDNVNFEGIYVLNPPFGVSFTDNTIIGNTADNNYGNGILVGASGNTIIGNSAHNNSRPDLQGSCSNVWQGNDFGTASPSCIG
jgi:parallel beta-helix repeat protein